MQNVERSVNDPFPGVTFTFRSDPTPNEVKELLKEASELASPPISNYKACVVAVSSTGKALLSANLEHPGLTLNETIYAEQAAVIQAHAMGWSDISSLYISAPPCGHCRQFLLELGDPDALTIHAGDAEPCSLSELLPENFGPSVLGNKNFLLDSSTSPNEAIFELSRSYSDAVVSRALLSAARSYCPYTEAYGGCALQLDTGEVLCGSYLESVAYNPTVSPSHYAGVLLSNRILLGSEAEHPKVVRAVLATSVSSKVGHFEPMSRILRAFAERGEYATPEIEVIEARL